MTIMDAQNMVPECQEKLQGETQKSWKLRSLRTDQALGHRQERTRRASDAASVQLGNTNNSCCGGATAGISTVFEDLWNRRTHVPPGTLKAEVRTLQEWYARLSAEVEDGPRQSLQKERTRCHRQSRQSNCRVSTWMKYVFIYFWMIL